MAATSAYTGISTVVQLIGGITQACPECGSTDFFTEELDALANHLMQSHEYKLLHVGQETSRDDNFQIWQNTVIVVGK